MVYSTNHALTPFNTPWVAIDFPIRFITFKNKVGKIKPHGFVIICSIPFNLYPF